jgi:CHAD domain-containing protein
VREREAKLGAGPAFVLPDLDGVIDGLTATALPPRHLDAVYYDTPDLRLARHGITVRHRSGEDDDGWTVKLPARDEPAGSALVRNELPFPGTRGAGVPPPALDLVSAHVRTSTLGAVARLRTNRTPVELRDEEQRRVAEVVDDEVSVLAGRRVAARFREVEVELDGTAPKRLLDRIVQRLRDAGAGEPDPTPKLVRALGWQATRPPAPAPDELGDDAMVSAVVREALVAAVTRLLLHDPGVRLGGDAEDVHKARVGTRRLRSDLRTFRSLLEPGWLATTRAELRWLGGELGAVRDADVLLERLQRHASELPARDSRGAATLFRHLTVQHDQARLGLLEAMRSPRYPMLLDGLIAAAEAIPVLPEHDKPARDVLPDLVCRPWAHLKRSVESLERHPPDEALHQVRIRAKRARYAAEAAAPVVGKPARAFAEAVSEVQGVLGDHQDAVVAEDWLRRVEGGRAVALVAGQLIARQRAESAATRRAWPAAWKRADAKKLRAWLS